MSIGRLVKVIFAGLTLRWIALELAANHHRLARLLRRP
jgi:hypothetical protein